jgi:hypothetical protein
MLLDGVTWYNAGRWTQFWAEFFFHLTTFPFSRVLNPLLQPPSSRDPLACWEPHLRPLHPCLHTRPTGRLLRLPPLAGSQDSPQGADWPHLACGGHIVSMATACPRPFGLDIKCGRAVAGVGHAAAADTRDRG